MKPLQVDRYCEDNDASTTTLKWIMLTLKYIESDWNDYESGQIGLVEWCCIMSMILCCVFVQVCLVCVYVFTYFTAEKVSKVTSTPEWMPLRPHPRNSQFIALNVFRLQSCACESGRFYLYSAWLSHTLYPEHVLQAICRPLE